MTNPKRYLDLRGKQDRANAAKAANQREANIAKQYFNAGPNIGNLAKAAYHWYNSVPMLGGQKESGLILQTGEAPSVGMRSPSSILKGVKSITKSIQSLTPRYNAFAQYYGYKTVPNGASAKEAESIIKQGLDQHNTFYRGLTVPKNKEAIKQILGKDATDREILDYFAKSGSRDPYNTYLSVDQRASQYARQGDVAIIKRKYQLGENPETWLDDADFVYNTAPATVSAPKGQINYPWAGKAIEKAPPGEVRMHPDDYTFEGWLPKTKWEYGSYVKPGEFNGSKNLYFNEAAGHKKPKFKDGGSIRIAPSKRGTFTTAATKHGMGVQEFANRILKNKDNYSPSLVKKANFARNASKWNH